MHRKIIGMLVCMLLFSIAVLPVTSNQVSESENVDACTLETGVRMFFFFKIDFSGKGEAVWEDPLVSFNLTEGKGVIFSLYSYELYKDGLKGRYFFSSYTITSPAVGFFFLLGGTVDYDPETEIVEIHGSGIYGVSGPQPS